MKIVHVLALALAVSFGNQVFAASDACPVCRQPFTAEAFFISSPYSTEPLMVCGACAKLQEHCATCRLPLKTNYVTLPDGRLLCQKDHTEAVFSTADAYAFFNEAKRFGMRMFAGCGTLPDRNIKLFLVDRRELDKLAKVQRPPEGRRAHLGLTRSTSNGADDMDHEIYLLNGMRKSQLQSVCVHEYTHAWLNQNMSRDRKIEVNAVEGFCELIAYNYMNGELRDPFEPGLILTNEYTQGQTGLFCKGQETYQFYPLIKWMKSGVDARLELGKLDRLLVLKENPQFTGWAPQAQNTAPDRLVLRSISGTGSRQFAMINNQTLSKGETAKVKVGNSSVLVKCLAILPKSVIVQIEGSDEKMELVLEGGRKTSER